MIFDLPGDNRNAYDVYSFHNLVDETSDVNEENNWGDYFNTNCNYLDITDSNYKFRNKSGYAFLHLNIRSSAANRKA